MGKSDENPVGELLSSVEQLDDDDGKVTIHDVAQQIGHRGYGPFLVIPAVIEFSPIGGVPGVPSVLASIIILFSLQMALGKKQVWIPQWLGQRSISSAKLKAATQSLTKLSHRIGWLFRERLVVLTRKSFTQVAGLLCICLALTVPALEIIPFASSAPMAVIAIFGLSLLFSDGLLMMVAAVACTASLYFGLSLAI